MPPVITVVGPVLAELAVGLAAQTAVDLGTQEVSSALVPHSGAAGASANSSSEIGSG